MDISILLALQTFRNGIGSILADFLSKMTFLAEMNTVLVIMAVLYWSVDKSLGNYLLMGWCGNRLVNGALKVTACAYRPWIRDARIVPYGNSMTTATSYSFPSGHTMNGASLYGGIAVGKNIPRVLRVALGITVALVGFSRLYLGVHTPQDVLVGAGVGLIIMWLTSKMMYWLDEHPERDVLVICIGLLLGIAVALYAGLKSYPVDYDAEGKILVDGAKMANDTFKGVGWTIAFLIGWIMERRFVGFTTEVSLGRKLTRTAIGLLTYYAVALILVPLVKGWIVGPAGTLISCFIQMFYVAFIFPWCCKHLEKQA